MDVEIKKKWIRWNNQKIEDIELKKELQSIDGDDKIIEDSFYKDLEFGTGGLRGIIGVGSNRMNIYTVAKATQGYSNYLNKNYLNPTVAIAYDSRINSQKFAEVTAEVFAANGIKVYIYSELMPTPALSYAIRYLQCMGGVVITASHNPAKYNGYKVYGADGSQITTQAAKAILSEINNVDIFKEVKKSTFNIALEEGTISYIKNDIIEAYLDAVSAQSLCRCDTIDKSISIMYTPLNGAGRKCVVKCLERNGFTNVSVVAEQGYPDGSFPTCPYPNPEIKEALELGLRESKRLKSELLLATDPDCDRVGIAVKSGEEYILLSANEVGMLLLDYICKRRIALGIMPKKPLLIKSIVTIDMANRIAEDYGVQVLDVLTGFKYIGEQIGLLEKRGEADRFILGFEESYGYLTGDFVRDKDGVNASLMICEMFAYYKSMGLTLIDVLNRLYRKYGYCLNTLHSYEFEGVEGFRVMQTIMSRFRTQRPHFMVGRKVLSVSDYKESLIYHSDGRTSMIHLPQSNVLKFNLEENLSVVIRPSGTEPKIKVYFSISAQNHKTANHLEKQFENFIKSFLFSKYEEAN